MITLRFSFPEIRPLMKQSWGLGWPIVFIMFFHLAIGLTDVYVAGYLGTDVLAAVGYVSQVYWTLQILANGITVGTVSMVSQAYSAKAFDGVGNITSHSLFMALGIAGALTVAAGLYPGAIVRLTGMPSEIQSIAEAFVRIYSLVLIPSYVVFVTAGVLRSSDRVQIAMVTAFISAAANVVGDFVLAFGWGPIPALGYRGIAWS
ncbi:MAG: MATE family efflux transporter, partial [Deltaproteobacteria bacterium]